MSLRLNCLDTVLTCFTVLVIGKYYLRMYTYYWLSSWASSSHSFSVLLSPETVLEFFLSSCLCLPGHPGTTICCGFRNKAPRLCSCVHYFRDGAPRGLGSEPSGLNQSGGFGQSVLAHCFSVCCLTSTPCPSELFWDTRSEWKSTCVCLHVHVWWLFSEDVSFGCHFQSVLEYPFSLKIHI